MVLGSSGTMAQLPQLEEQESRDFALPEEFTHRSPKTSPRVEIELSLTPQTYTYTRPSAPTITLRLSLIFPDFPGQEKEDHPITLYTEGSPLDMRRALSSGGFTIKDLATDTYVQTTKVTNVQRFPNPKRRVQGCPEAPYFVTLEPGADATVELSSDFGRHNFHPQPWSVVKLGREVDETGQPRNIRRSASVTGVDGLEPGHEYEVGLNVDALRKIIWAPVLKDDILLEKGYEGPGDKLGDYPWVTDHPLDFVVHNTKLKLLSQEGGAETP